MANKFEKPKDPNSVADYGLDWSLRLVSDTILTSTWIVPDGITANSNSHTDHDNHLAGRRHGWRNLFVD
jgi:hypothetical protein